MQDLNKALRHLKKDPVLKALIDRFGSINYQPPPDRFTNLVSEIIGQQLSSKAADTIYSRFLTLFPNKKFTPKLILNQPLEKLRGIGTSWAKARSLHDLSQKVLAKTVQLDQLDSLSDEEVIAHLTAVKGIGRWTAEMKLMFTLQRPDILPLDDVGIQNAFVKHHGLNRKHKNLKKFMVNVAEPWKPYRTVACWYLWKSLDN